jgi:hypothetical protein
MMEARPLGREKMGNADDAALTFWGRHCSRGRPLLFGMRSDRSCTYVLVQYEYRIW